MTAKENRGASARNVPGDEFCLTCYKRQLGLTDQRGADDATTALVATGKFKLEPGRCKKCGKTGIMLRAVEKG
jgi:hypothetical protein